MQRQTQTIPLVFAGVGDPVAGGLLKSVASPEGNTTGVTNYFPSFGGKWLELLKEAGAPPFQDSTSVQSRYFHRRYFATLEAAAPQFAVTLVRTPYRDAADLVHAIDAFAAESNGGLIILPPAPIATQSGVDQPAGGAAWGCR